MIQIKDDKFWVSFHGDRNRKQEALIWCHELWGGDWGDIREERYQQVDGLYWFVFHRSDHAVWFHLKFG